MKTNLALLLFSVLFLSFSSCSSVDENDAPNVINYTNLKVGDVKKMVEKGELNSKTELILEGEMDVFDFQALGRLGRLERLNLEKIKVIGSKFYSNITESEFESKYVFKDDVLFVDCFHLNKDETESGSLSYPIPQFDLFLNLKNIILPKSLKEIGSATFARLKIENLVIPAELVGIHSTNLFYQCPELKSVTFLCENLEWNAGILGTKSFYDCPKLETVNYSEASSLKGYIVGIANCPNLKTIRFSSDAEYLGYHTSTPFLDNVGIEKLTIPGIKELFWMAVINCDNLKEVVIEDGEEPLTIFHSSFYNCSNLTKITFPKHLDHFYDHATKVPTMFDTECRFTEIHIRATTPPELKNLNEDATIFAKESIENATLYVPTGTKAAYEADPMWNEFKQIIEE